MKANLLLKVIIFQIVNKKNSNNKDFILNSALRFSVSFDNSCASSSSVRDQSWNQTVASGGTDAEAVICDSFVVGVRYCYVFVVFDRSKKKSVIIYFMRRDFLFANRIFA